MTELHCVRCANGDSRTPDGFHAMSTGHYVRCADLPPYEGPPRSRAMADERFPTYEQLFAGWEQMQAERNHLQTLLDAALKRLAENDEEIMQLRAVALAARALVQSVQPSLDADLEVVSEPALTALESALEAAGYGMSEEEAVDG